MPPLPQFLLGTIVPSLVIAWAAGFLVRAWAPRWGLLDHPAARKMHVQPTPMGGGLAIWLGVLVPFAVGQMLLWWIQQDPSRAAWLPEFARVHVDGLGQQMASLWVLLGAGSLLLLLGLADDRWGLPWQLRIGVQFAVAAVCVLWQEWRLTAFIPIDMFTWGLSILWIVMLVNSFNMLDNMDGLSGGVAAIASVMLAAVLLRSPDPATGMPQLFVAGFLLVLAGALVGFLWHNRPTAKMFMGDAGSYFVGFCLAVATLLATYTSYHSDRPFNVLAPLCVLAVPLYDLTTVLWIRLREGRSPFHADKSHFSHRLVERGLTKTQAVLTIYLTSATCGLGALLLHQVDWTGAVVILLIVACILALIAILESTGRRKSDL